MGRANLHGYQRAFALPTVLITSVVMLTVLLSALTATSSVSVSLRNQYINQIAREAAQSGATMAKACMAANGGSITWTRAKPLKPNTDCDGEETTSCPITAISAACYVLKSGNYRTLFKVKPILDEDDTITGIASQGLTREVRKTSGEVLREVESTLKASTNATAGGGGSGVVEGVLSTGFRHTCAVDSNDKAYCWGLNSSNQLGDSTGTQRATPVAVSQGAIPAGVTIKTVNSGYYHSCAQGSNDKVYCWGTQNYGELGNSSTFPSATPVAVSQGAIPAGVNMKTISMGSQFHICTVGTNDKAYCWGYGTSGALGNGSTGHVYTPTAVSQGAIPAGVNIKTIVGGYLHTCALGTNDKAYCWGEGTYRQLGDSSTTQRNTPVAVSQGTIPAGVTIKSLAAGYRHTCAIGSDNKAYCWGVNSYGELGNGTTSASATPTAVSQGAIPAGVTIKSIVAGYYHTCAIGSDNKAYCWGRNSNGQLGDNTTAQRNTPVAVAQGAIPAGVTIKSISAGSAHTCTVGSDGKAYCWGYNNEGQLGDNTTTQRTTPVAVQTSITWGGSGSSGGGGGGDVDLQFY